MSDFSQPPRPPAPKGISCPRCRCTALRVAAVRKPCPGLVVRYRRCRACGTGVICEERVARSRAPLTHPRAPEGPRPCPTPPASTPT